MKVLFLIALSTLILANTHNFNKVWVSDKMTIRDVKMVGKDLYYNGKKMDDRYIIISCRKPEGFCLKERK